MIFIHAKELVVDNQLGRKVVSALLVLGKMGTGHRIDIGLLVVISSCSRFIEDVGTALQHRIVAVGISTCDGVLLIDAHVRHLLHSDGKEVVTVELVLGISQGEVG